MVSLPSIREMFPQFMADAPSCLKVSSHPPSPLASPRDAGWRGQYSPPYPTTTTMKPLFITKPIQPVDAYSPLNWSPTPRSPLSPAGSPVLPAPQSMHPSTPRRQRGSTSRRPPVRNMPTATPDSPGYSFGVFKSNPDGTSLDHIASTTTFRRGKSNSGQQGLQAEVAKGVTPGFIVAISPPSASYPPASQRSDDCKIELVDGGNASPPLPPATYSSFLLSDSNSNSNFSGQGTIFISDQDEGTNGGHQRSSEKGKVHECPHCSKRFNRPSSLQIHANTHTGARPFRCPHPNCGREFNVNSNMRRHYRNHARPTFSRTHPPHSKLIRRRMEQISTSTMALAGIGDRTVSPDAAAAARKHATLMRSPRDPHMSASDESGGDTCYDAETGRGSESPESVWDHEVDDMDMDMDDAESGQSDTHGPLCRNRHLADNTRSRSASLQPCRSSRLEHSRNRDQTPPHSNSYTPSSAVYLQSCTELNVSTVLRPAFSSSIPLRSNFIQEGLVW